MARKKRASMREGPLATLFASTEPKGPAEDEITITGPQSRRGVEHPEVDGLYAPPAERIAEPEQAEPAGTDQPPAPEARAEAPAPSEAEPEQEPASPQSSEVATPEAPEAPDAPEAPEAPVVDEPAREPEHRGLERLLGGSPDPATDERPTYGRAQPDLNRQPVMPRRHSAVLRVVGVGGAGVNAVNRMIEAGVSGVEFIAVNTDLQSLQSSRAETTLHIGGELTRGLGSGSDPRVGYRAAFDAQDKIKSMLKGSDMVFVAAGAGGGTGTGAAPVVAKLARDVGALTVGTVTKPFGFEGARRTAQAEEGVAALGAEVDTLIVVPNERLLEILERRTSIEDAFSVADDVLRQAVQGISDLVMLPGLINLDFADVRTTMLEAGDAILGIGMGVGEHRAVLAAEKAVSSPILNTSVEGATSLLLSVTGGPDLSLIEASEAARVVQEAAHPDANIIFGASIDEDLAEQVWITVIATRFESSFAHRHKRDRDAVVLDRRRASDYRGREPRSREPGRPVDDWFADDDPAFLDPDAELDDHGRPVHEDRPPTHGRLGPPLPSERPPTAPGEGTRHRVDPPEFIPGH